MCVSMFSNGWKIVMRMLSQQCMLAGSLSNDWECPVSYKNIVTMTSASYKCGTFNWLKMSRKLRECCPNLKCNTYKWLRMSRELRECCSNMKCNTCKWLSMSRELRDQLVLQSLKKSSEPKRIVNQFKIKCKCALVLYYLLVNICIARKRFNRGY